MSTQALKRILIGDPLESHREHEERLTKKIALTVFSSDAMSSVAYATEEILLVLVLAGTGALRFSVPVALAIIALLTILTISYRQVIEAYPNGGGAYVVASENFSYRLGLVAGAGLAIGYILTVAVSIASGVAALTSAAPALLPYRVEFGILFILLVTLANLRGVKESGRLFAVPTYAFIFGLLLLIVVGLYKYFNGYTFTGSGVMPQVVTEQIGLFLLLRAFSSGCAALTGVEAMSNGVQAFKAPEAKNAKITLVWMALILGTVFLGITQLAHLFNVVPSSSETVVSQLARGIFGSGAFYFFLQITTMLILIVAANTSYAGFPRVSYLMARDGFLPRQLMNKGNKLAYSNGIIILALFSIALLVLFRGDTHRLIPLYAIGVFLSFTISQFGMVKHWFTVKGRGWTSKAFINGAGTLATLLATLIIAFTKFSQGAWIVIVLIPFLMAIFLVIRRHYRSIADQLSLCNIRPIKPANNWVLVCIGGVHCGTLQAVRYAKMIASEGHLRAVYINTTDKEPTEMLQKWDTYGFSTPLQVVSSPYRDIIGPIIDTVMKMHKENPDDFITVVVPEFIVKKSWQRLLHNQTALLLKMRLLLYPNVIVTSVPYQLM